MRAVVIEKPGAIAVTDIADPTPQPGELVIAVRACGICGTDLHILHGDLPPTPYPITPGHEFGGVVAAVGAGVTGFAEGDRVGIDPSLYDDQGEEFREGRPNISPDWQAVGVTQAGAAADYVAVPVRTAYHLPDGVPWKAAALIEPVSCAVRGYDRLPRRLGSHYLIYGAGTMGLLMLQLAAKAGASSVEVVDTNAGRLDMARQLGATNAATSADELDRQKGWEVVIDATGVIAAIEDGLTRVRRGGTFLQFGVAPSDATARFSPFRVYNEEIDIIGSMAVLHSYQRARDLVADGVIDVDAMVSDVFDIGDYQAAIDRFVEGAGRKIQVTPDLAAL